VADAGRRECLLEHVYGQRAVQRLALGWVPAVEELDEHQAALTAQ
jgi:hypothetical protein